MRPIGPPVRHEKQPNFPSEEVSSSSNTLSIRRININIYLDFVPLKFDRLLNFDFILYYGICTFNSSRTRNIYKYSYFYINSNGSITFGNTNNGGDTTYQNADWWKHPRISAVFQDLNPESSGNIYYKTENNKIYVCFDGIVRYGALSGETGVKFQIILNKR